MHTPAGNLNEELLKRISPELAWFYRIIPQKEEDGILFLLIDEQKDTQDIQNELEVVFDKKLSFITTGVATIDQLLSKFYLRNHEGDIQGQQSALEESFESDNFLLNIIHEATTLNSSDVHIEVYDNKARIRLRIDGLLVERHVLDKTEYPSIVNRIKIMSNLDIAEKRLPQDGRIFFNEGHHKFDIRVSVLPTMFGEKMVLRLLRSGNKSISLDSLGFELEDQNLYMEGIRKPNGIVLISGPTGTRPSSAITSIRTMAVFTTTPTA